MPKVTVILPSLNVGDYIEECIKSVVAQTLRDLEILAIDAGSTDGTVEILESHAQKDQRIKVIHAEKRSYGYQVNLGLAMAEGDYIGVVETDDWIEPDMYQVLYDKANEYRADFAKGIAEGFLHVTDTSMRLARIAPFSEMEYAKADGEILLGAGDMLEMLRRDGNLWSGIYRAEILKDIRLHESPGAAYQDVGFLFQVFCKAQSGISLNKPFYHYRMDRVGASGFSKKAFHNLLGEYSFVEQFLPQLELDWQKMVYENFARDFLYYYRKMTAQRVRWENSKEDVVQICGKLRAALEKDLLTGKYLGYAAWTEVLLAIISEDLLFRRYQKWFVAKQNVVDYVIEKGRAKHCVIFGCGINTEYVHLHFLLRGMGDCVDAYCDNGREKQGQSRYELAIISPEFAVKQYPHDYYIIANKKHRQAMQEQLKKLGIKDEQILFYEVTHRDREEMLLLANFV